MVDAVDGRKTGLSSWLLTDVGLADDPESLVRRHLADGRVDRALASFDALGQVPAELRRLTESARIEARRTADHRLAKVRYRAASTRVEAPEVDEQLDAFEEQGRLDLMADVVTAAEDLVQEAIDEQCAVLRAQIEELTAGAPEEAQSVADDLRRALEQGALDQVRMFLRRTDHDQLPDGPVFLPLRRTPVDPDAAMRALVALVSGDRAVPVGLGSRVSDPGRALLTALVRLSEGASDVATPFAEAFAAACYGRPSPKVERDESGTGYQVRCPALVNDPHARRFEFGRGETFLWIPGPGASRPPRELWDRGSWFAISLESRDRTAPRGPVATLDPLDLLDLACNPPRFGASTAAAASANASTTLLRIAGRQWPLRRFVPDEPAGFDRVLGPDEERFLRLWWLLDITGLGGFTEASVLAFETALLSGILGPALHQFDQLDPPARQAFLANPLDDGAMRVAVEDDRRLLVPLDTVRDADRAALCAVIAARRFDEPISVDELAREVVTEAQYADAAPGMVDLLCQAIERLHDAHLIELEPAGRTYILPPSGVAFAIEQVCRDRLPGRLGRLAEQVDARGVEASETLRRIAVEMLRHLRRRLEGARREAEDAGDRAKMAAIDLEMQVTEDDLVDSPGGYLPTGVLEDIEEPLKTLHSRLRIRYELDVLPEIAIPGALLAYVVRELVANALAATPGGCTVEIFGYVADREVVIGVSDNGPGIPPDNIQQVFELGVSANGEGRGSGLHIVRQMLEARGCTIELRSDGVPGRGVEAVLRIPVLAP